MPTLATEASNPLHIPVLTTARTLIRPLGPGDLEAVCGLFAAIGWTLTGLSQAEQRKRRRSWLEWAGACAREFARLGQPPYGERAVADRADGRLLGLIGLVPAFGPFAQLPSFGGQKDARYAPEVGLFWALDPKAQGQGLATEAARAFVEHVAAALDVRRLVATTEHDNSRSIALMRRLGMKIERNPFPEPDWFHTVGILEFDGPPSRGRQAPPRDADGGR